MARDISAELGGLVNNLKVTSWKRHGHDRLYVNLPDGTAVGWMDCKSGETTVLVSEYRDAVGAALARFAGPAPGLATPAVGDDAPRALPLLTPENDLAKNRPGEELRQRLAASGPGLWQRVIAWVLRRRTDDDSWRTGLVGEQRVGRELERLERQGWRVLHAIPLPRQVDIDHLLIGPGGVFTINTKRHPQKRVWVGDDMVKVNGGKAQPYVIKSRAEAGRARKVLGRYCGFDVPVRPILVFVDVLKLDMVPTQLSVRVLQERAVSALGPLSGVLTAPQIEHLYSVARDRRVWGDA
ncbi:NERD nuclease [Streptomyces sp. CB03578]|uniref:nuclease-related domain-containing protein n=1 Tax=Streptomyces sp. CB03578 TaxID=1718987 RepID=UPI00093F77E0|nr:nuclease-related domain-containing protein [Streptomyces sp. CB03578]OKI29496.1 NERD nuclease [Streptomyces sp. CB03578]